MKTKINKIIFEIRAGAGDETSLFAGDLSKMYQKYAMNRDWKWEALEVSEGGSRGYKTFVAEVSGDGVYDSLRQESGVHRVQHVPVTERQGRVYTSTAPVAALPVVEPKAVEIKESDLRCRLTSLSRPASMHGIGARLRS